MADGVGIAVEVGRGVTPTASEAAFTGACRVNGSQRPLRAELVQRLELPRQRRRLSVDLGCHYANTQAVQRPSIRLAPSNTVLQRGDGPR